MNAPSDATSRVGCGDVGPGEAERLMQWENERRDVRANVFLVTMVGIGALTVLATVALGGSGRGTQVTPNTSGSVSASR